MVMKNEEGLEIGVVSERRDDNVMFFINYTPHNDTESRV